jgi:hypothetical protein
MAERIHRWSVRMTGSTPWGSITSIGSESNAPNPNRSPQRLRDAAGVIHSVVKGPDEIWRYCDIEVMKDWLVQDGQNVVSDDTPLTCVKCLAEEHEE